MKIAFISQPEYFRFMYENDLDGFAEIQEFVFSFCMTANDFDSLLEFDAEYNIFFRGEFFPSEVLKKIKGKKIALSSEPFPRYVDDKLEYSLDSVDRFRCFRSIRDQNFDYVFHYDKASIPFMEKDGLYLSGDFPFPVATGVYFPLTVDKVRDIFFIGRSTLHREKFFGSLKHYHNFLHICHGVWGPNLNEYMNSAKICLNVHAENETSWEPRLQMMLATGAFVISEKITPNFFLRPGIDYVEVTSPQEMWEAVSYYLNHDEEREKIARSGLERVKDILDAKVCFYNLIKKIEDDEIDKFQTGKSSKIVNSINYFVKTLQRINKFAQEVKNG